MHIEKAKNMFWGVTLDGGKRYTQTVESSFHLSMAALEPSKGKSDTLVSIMIQHEKAEFMLCTLQHGKTYQQPLDLNFTEGEEVTFFLTNDKSVVHLSGYLMEDDQYPDDFGESMMDESSEEESDEDEAPSLVSDEEEGQKVPGGKKRKKEKVKAVKKKKMKMEDSDDEDDDDDDFDIEDDFADFIDDEAGEGSEEDDEEEDDDDDEILKLKKKPTPQKKKQKDTPQKKNQGKQETQTPKQTENNSQEVEGKKKKKKKKKKNKNKEGDEKTNSTETPNKQQQPKKQVLAGGIVCEELKVGHGPVAQPGKMVHVYYSGKLQKTGQQFDSCQGGKPFRFRLGKGEVIKGWDVGVSGMKVGGKRKLVIPSQQGYGNQRQGPIPPGSTLMFEVELKSVS
ncbi:FK506-binding nuclear protein [Mytilus galloprovincialis]|uniref:FK506-binding protein n=2 Tax=Mytilus galloprovincialis TaxID=29158 RepID=A0A8B6C2X3_MYTGA|nr:FK506-binding nuclear protein [Mytilus galloprovincialis]